MSSPSAALAYPPKVQNSIIIHTIAHHTPTFIHSLFQCNKSSPLRFLQKGPSIFYLFQCYFRVTLWTVIEGNIQFWCMKLQQGHLILEVILFVHQLIDIVCFSLGTTTNQNPILLTFLCIVQYYVGWSILAQKESAMPLWACLYILLQSQALSTWEVSCI